MSKCQICKIENAEWAWQPFGPAETPNCFTFLGSHYRGFPIVKTCTMCKNDIQAGCPERFEIYGQHFIGNSAQVLEIPKYVIDGDPLLFWEENKDK